MKTSMSEREPVRLGLPGWTLVLMASLAASSTDAQTVTWENRGQPEFAGTFVEVNGGQQDVVAVGDVRDESFASQWFVRAADRRTGATRWEDRYGPALFGLAKDVAVEGQRAFVVGWTRVPGEGFVFVVRAYGLKSGALLWSHEVSRGPRCVEERPGFARCVAKAVAVHGGRVFVVGHLTRTAASPDFAVLAFDAATGSLLWESVTDPTGTGAEDYAWAVKAVGDSVFVSGEIGQYSALLVRSYDAATGAIHWQQEVVGARNFTYKNTLAADGKRVFIAGEDANEDFMVRAYDARSGALLWADRIDDGDRVGAAGALALGAQESEGERKRKKEPGILFATGVIGCNAADFLECKLAVRAYDPGRGLLWQRADDAAGGDWYPGYTAAASDSRVFVQAGERLEDGQYHSTLRAYAARSGTLVWDEPFDPGSDPPGFSDAAVIDGDLFVDGQIFTAVDGSSDAVLRMYRGHERDDDDRRH